MDEIRRLKAGEMDASFDLSSFAFQYDLSEKEREERRAFTRPELTWGYFINHKLAAKMTIHPIQTYINGRIFDVGGLASVATWPEYRRKGLVTQLLDKSLQVMKEAGITISFLHPFSIPFYRKFGWELYTDYMEYELTASHLPKGMNSQGSVERVDRDWLVLHDIYTEYAIQYNGMVVRNEDWWNQVVFRQKKGQAVIYRNQEGQARGYMIYEVRNRKLVVGEFIWLDLEAWFGLWKFITNHDSMFDTLVIKGPSNDPLPFLLHNPTCKQQSIPYFMARLVDVVKYLEQAIFMQHNRNDIRFLLKLEDRQASWNDGWFEIVIPCNGKARVNKLEADPLESGVDQDSMRLKCDIQTLTTMLLGYKRPTDLQRYGRIQADSRTVDALERVIPRAMTYLSDYF